MDVGPEHAVRFWPELIEELALADVFQSSGERSPEIFAYAAVQLTGERLKRRLELANGIVALILLIVNQRQTVVHVGALGIQLQRVAIVNQRAFHLAGFAVILGQREVRIR